MIQVVRRSIVDVYNRYSFNRQSLAYDSKGRLYHLHNARFEQGKFGQAVMVEEGTTNLADPNAFTVYPGAAATRSVQVGGPYDGWYRVDVTAANSDNRHIAYNASVPTIAHGETRTLSLEFVSESGNITPFMDGSVAVGALVLVPGTNRWVKTWTNTLGAPKDEGIYFKSATGGAISETFYYRFCMQEAKPYATSFHPSTRSPETLTIPTAGVLSPQEGTISVWAYINDIARRQVPGQYNCIWHVQGANPKANINIHHRHDRANWSLQIYDDNRNQYFVLVDDSLIPDGWHMLAVRWKNGEYADIFIDGVLRGHIDNPIMPSAFSEFRLGYNSTYCNTVYDDLRISSRARTDEEIAAAYQSGQPLPVDADTTYKLNFDGPDAQRAAKVLIV
jgi:hypothetical protein